MKSFLSFFFFLFFFLFSFSQVWYFGYGAGIKFENGNVAALHDGKISTNEGCSAAYDEKGDLIFYTDGVSVWDKDHRLYKNGEGLNGNNSSTQSALIVPKPGNKNLFYIFTSDTSAGGKGICYSLINATMNMIVSKNQKLFSPAAEKLTACFNKNGKDVWVITHAWNSNNFLSYPLTEKGIGASITSSAGIVHKETGSGRNRETIGEMKFSPDGKKLAVAICYRKENNLEIFDFDNSTGKILNPQTFSLNGFPYGICFSPDNSKLYISFLKGKDGVIQYDLLTKQFTSITLNEKENSFGSLQIGPDKKIYIARVGNFLDVISFPDKTGTLCSYTKNSINLSPSSCSYGLPNLIYPATAYVKKIIPDCSKIIEKPFSKDERMLEISTCEEKITLDAKNFGASYNWSTLATTSTITVDTSGIYKVEIKKDGCVFTDSVRLRFRKDMSVFRYLSAFNPESEFLNSEFYYSIDEVYNFDLKIFNKRAKLIFETKNPEQKWNGKNPKGEFVPAGEYDWEVHYKPLCPKDAKPKNEKGKVTVKRNKK